METWGADEWKVWEIDIMADDPNKLDSASAAEDRTATLTMPSEKPAAPKRRPRRLPPYKVLLHNDEVNTFEHVIRSIVQIAALQPEEAIVKALEAHETGVALLLVTHLERAELYADQFTSVKLTVTIEPDSV